MRPFDSVFRALAKREYRIIPTADPSGKPGGTYLFREYFCDQPGCDCRRVVIGVEWLEREQVAAAINYYFEPSRHRDEPQLFLDDQGPTNKLARMLLALFEAELEHDPAYRDQLVEHYLMWKQASDRPKPRAAKRTPPKPRAAKPAPRTAHLKAVANGLQRLVAFGAQAGKKVQQRFGRLIKKVEQLKHRVRAWHDAKPAILAEIAANNALFATHRERGRELVRLLDRAHADPIFTKAERKRLRAILVDHARELLLAEDHDETKAIYNRHTGGDFDAELARESKVAAREMKSELEEMFGVELGDVASMEELRAQTEELLREAEQAPRKQTPKQAAKADAERTQVSKTLQDVYRKLAVALHPDLELDPDERTRKTTLMQQVNAAYEAKDLLQLLELQLRFEQVDPTKLDAIAEDRLKRYNTILDEQARQLEAELEELELPFRLELELSPAARVVPAQVFAKLRADAREIQLQAVALEHDLETFADLAQLKASLRRQPSRGEDLYG